MGYTQTIQGKSKNVLITGTPKSLEDLIGAKPVKKTNRVTLSFTGSLVGVNPVAWITEDGGVVVAPDNGEPVYPGGRVTITPDNFETFSIIKHSGGDFNMWLKQFDSEQDSF